MKTFVSTVLIIVMIAACGVGEADTIVDRDIVLAMPFDEGRGETTKDLSPYGNHGTFKRNAKWGKGKFGNAVQFEPVGYVDAGNDESLNLLKSDFTLAMWINMKETLFGHRHAFIAQDEGFGIFNKWIFGYSINGNLGFNFLRSTGNGKTGWSFNKYFNWVVQPKIWHQVALVRRWFKDGSFWEEFTIYLNGEQIEWVKIEWNSADNAIVPIGNIPPFIDAPVTIGWAEEDMWLDGAGVEDIWLDGAIDEVLIAKRAFTAKEITAHFQGGIKRGLLVAVQPTGKSAAVWGAIKGLVLR